MTADRDPWATQMREQYPVVERPGWDGLAISDLDDCMCHDDQDRGSKRLAVLTVLSGLLLLVGLTAAIVHRWPA